MVLCERRPQQLNVRFEGLRGGAQQQGQASGIFESRANPAGGDDALVSPVAWKVPGVRLSDGFQEEAGPFLGWNFPKILKFVRFTVHRRCLFLCSVNPGNPLAAARPRCGAYLLPGLPVAANPTACGLFDC